MFFFSDSPTDPFPCPVSTVYSEAVYAILGVPGEAYLFDTDHRIVAYALDGVAYDYATHEPIVEYSPPLRNIPQ